MKRNEEYIGKSLAGDDAVWNKLKYDCDGIIEASAGTGKTFTLQRIVLKLVSDVEHPVDVKNILLVTFTEKAAGELKDRIRTILEDAGCLKSDFAEATICTIHSFCRELLRAYAFENRVPMQFDIANSDDDLIHRAVRTALLGDEFRAKYGELFSAYMAVGEFATSDVLASEAEKRLKDCARLGVPPAELAEVPASDKQKLRELVAKLCPKGEYEQLGKILGLDTLPINGRDQKAVDLDFPDFQALLPTVAEDDKGEFIKAVAKYRTIRGRGTSRLNPRISKPYKCKLCEHIPLFGEIIDLLDRMGGAFFEMLGSGLAVLAWPEFQRLKDDSSAMTFDDLVAKADQVIAREADSEEKGGHSDLLEAIRRRYRIALVDEFQDTDRKQWDIFRRIFSSKVNRLEGEGVPEPKQGCLLVVGDPKQAIYGFRGADVATYLAAKEAITTGDSAQPEQSLGFTYRSTRELVNAFNTMFGDKSGWFDGMTEGDRSIEYSPVKYPEDNERFCGLVDHTGREAVSLLESLPSKLPDPVTGNSGYGNKGTCLPIFLENAAREMTRLHALTPAYMTKDKDGNDVPGAFEYRDMCILVRGHTDAQTAQRVLAKHKIPSAYYKEAGLFATEEAEALLALFDFLSAPGNSGNLAALLMTPLFHVHPSDLGKILSEDGNVFAQLLEKWQALAAERDWNKLFESVMNESSLSRPAAGDFAFDRRWTAFRQMLDKLLAANGRSALAVEEFATLLRSWCKNDKSAGENGALRQKESEGDRVQIMTMHASKGLEFKAVFVAAGMNWINEEELNEVKRLFYVALTRAEHKLYLPWTQWSPHKRGKKGKNEEVIEEDEHGIGSHGSALLGDGFLAKGILAYFGDNAKNKVLSPEGAAEASGNSRRSGYSGTCGCAPKLYALPYLGFRKVQWDSFTSLARGKTPKKPKEDNAHTPDEHHGESGGMAKSLLPRNNVSGDVFHKIMEALCGNDEGKGEIGFAIGQRELTEALENEQFAKIVLDTMRGNAIGNQEKNGDSTAKTLMRMVWSALNAEIRFPNGASFFLRDIPHADRRAEVKFCIDEKSVYGDELPMLDNRERKGAFNGSVDLLVRPEGRSGPVYILDWKTNSLTVFDDTTVDAEIARERYDLQYKLYSLAVKRWLGEDALAGVAYLFVRGGEDGKGRVGIHARDMDSALADECRQAVWNALPKSKTGK